MDQVSTSRMGRMEWALETALIETAHLGALRYNKMPSSPKRTLGVHAATIGGIPAWVADTDINLALKT